MNMHRCTNQVFLRGERVGVVGAPSNVGGLGSFAVVESVDGTWV